MADARNAQLKHVRKTDGKNDASLDTAEASANKVLAGRHCCLLLCGAGSAAMLPLCSCMRSLHRITSSGVQSGGRGVESMLDVKHPATFNFVRHADAR